MSACHSQSPAPRRKDGRLPYQYRTLDRAGREIRLLEVLPGSKGEPLRAKFVSEFLSGGQLAPYETISYAWGDPRLRGEIEIEDSFIDIPGSSDSALRCMRRPDVCRRLWIDAVCINQDDIAERSSQVQIMSEIYRSSSHNLVYLGEEDASTKSAVVSIGRALEELNARLDMLENSEKLLRRPGSRRTGPPMKCEIDVAAINQFFQRPWFSRMWIVQEVVFAPVSTCYCGPDICVDLLSVLLACSYIHEFHPSSLSFGKLSPIGYEMRDSLIHCAQLRPFVESKERLCEGLSEDGSAVFGELGCLELIKLGKPRLCADSRDKIFSIVGLIEQARAETPREGGADLSLLEVDYNKSFKDVLRDATRFCIQQSRDLELWYGVLRHPNSTVENGDILLDGFCSWVPRTDIPWEYQGEVLRLCHPRANAGLPVSRETGLATTADPNVLTLDGYAVTEVIDVSHSLGIDLFRHGARLADTLTSIFEMCREVISPGPTRSNGFPECLARTLAVLPYQGVHDDDELFLEMQKHVCSVFDSGSKNGESKYWSEEAETLFKLGCSRRRIFTGSSGYIGQGPSCLRAGDRIVVLFGGIVPFAVRPLTGDDGGLEEHYQLLGEVYVHGAMYGEVVEAAMAGGKEPRIFHFV